MSLFSNKCSERRLRLGCGKCQHLLKLLADFFFLVGETVVNQESGLWSDLCGQVKQMYPVDLCEERNLTNY